MCKSIVEEIGFHFPYDGVVGWEKRLEKTFTLIEKMESPDIITIARSQGQKIPYKFIEELRPDIQEGESLNCTPADKLLILEEKLMTRLERIYSQNYRNV